MITFEIDISPLDNIFCSSSVGNFGELNFKDESIINLDSCTNACTTGSTFRFEVYETERVGSVMG